MLSQQSDGTPIRPSCFSTRLRDRGELVTNTTLPPLVRYSCRAETAPGNGFSPLCTQPQRSTKSASYRSEISERDWMIWVMEGLKLGLSASGLGMAGVLAICQWLF